MSKTNINRFGLKFVMLLVLALCGKVAMAQNSLSVENFTIDSYSVYNVPVLLTNDEPVYNVQFDIVLPDELELAATPYMDTNRCSIQYQSLSWNADNRRVMIKSQAFQPIKGTEGAVAYIPVKLAFGANVNTTYTLKLKNYGVFGANGKTLQWNQTTPMEVTVTAVPGTVTGYAPAAEILANPGETFELPFAFKNTCNVVGFQVNLNLPAGFTVNTVAEGAERLTAGTQITVVNNATYTGIVVVNLDNNPAVTGNEGVVFNLKVTAPENWEGEGKATFSNLVVSYIAGKEFNGTGYNVNLANGATAYTQATAEIEALQAALDAKLAEIAATYPEVADQVTGEAVQAQIDALKAAVDAAYADHTLTANYETVMAPVAAINAAIEALDAEAQEALRKFNNNGYYNACVEAFDYYQEILNAVVAQVAEEYPLANVATYVAAAQDLITNGRQALEAAKQACETEGSLAYEMPAEAIEEAIEAILTDAARQYTNFGVEAEVAEQLGWLQQNLDEVVAAIAEQYPDADITAAVAAVQTMIDEANAAFEAAKEACAAEGTFKFDFTGEFIEAATEALYTEAQRQYANNEEYAMYNEQMNFLQGELDDAIAYVAENCPVADMTEQFAAVQTEINEAKAALEAAKEACATEGTFKFDFTGEFIENEINAIKAEAERQQNNATEYAMYNEIMNFLQNNLNEKAAEVAETYPLANVSAEVAAIQAQINTAKAELEAAKEACATEGNFVFNFSGSEIEAATDALLTEAQRQYANMDAEAEYGAMIAAAQEMLDEAKATVATTYPDANVTALIDAAQAMIDKANVDLEAAKAACATEGNFHFDFDMMPIEMAIDKIVPEAERQHNNAAAYAEYNAMIEAAQQMLDEAKATVAEEFPGTNVKDEVAAAQALINQAKTDLEAAKAACATEGNFHFDFDMMVLENAINKVLEAAQFQADVQSKYDAAVSAIDALQTKLDTTKGTVASLYEDVDIDGVAAAAQAAITKAYNDAQAALEAAATSGAFDYTVPTADIDALIAAIAPEAKRQSENTKAYEADKATLAALEDELNKVLDEVTTKYPGAAVLAETLAAQKAITDAYKAVDAAYAAVAEAGTYTSPVDAAAIKALIDEIMAVASGIDEVLVEELGGDVKFYNLSGIQVKHPAAGSVVIAVGANGQVRKLLVK